MTDKKPKQPKKWQDKVQPEPPARMHKPHKDEHVSLEARFLPSVRKLIDYLAASKGMAAAECIEAVVVDAINNNPDIMKRGEQRLRDCGGRLTRVKLQDRREKLERLEALEAAQRDSQNQR